MIIGFTGTPGSGKSYEAVKKILDNLQWGRVVYTNIDGIMDGPCLEAIKSYCGLSDLALKIQLHFLEEDQVPEFWEHITPGCLVVLDEVQKVFSSREWQSTKNNRFASWASTHRHNGYDLVLITQAIERIDSAVRCLLEWTYDFRKINFFGGAVQKKYLCYSYAGEDTNCTPLKKSAHTYNKNVFLCYKSYVTKDTKELGFMQHVNVLKHPIFFAIPVVFALVVYMIFFKSSLGSGDLFGANAAIAKTQIKNPAVSSSAPSSVAVSPVVPIFSRNEDGIIVYSNKPTVKHQ